MLIVRREATPSNEFALLNLVVSSSRPPVNSVLLNPNYALYVWCAYMCVCLFHCRCLWLSNQVYFNLTGNDCDSRKMILDENHCQPLITWILMDFRLLFLPFPSHSITHTHSRAEPVCLKFYVWYSVCAQYTHMCVFCVYDFRTNKCLTRSTKWEGKIRRDCMRWTEWESKRYEENTLDKRLFKR